jgi:hypothetical protein
MLYDVACRNCGADVLSAAGFRAGGRWVIRYACRSCSESWEVESDERISRRPSAHGSADDTDIADAPNRRPSRSIAPMTHVVPDVFHTEAASKQSGDPPGAQM